VWDAAGSSLLYVWRLPGGSDGSGRAPPPSAAPTSALARTPSGGASGGGVSTAAVPPSCVEFVRGVVFGASEDGAVQLCAGTSGGDVVVLEVTVGGGCGGQGGAAAAAGAGAGGEGCFVMPSIRPAGWLAGAHGGRAITALGSDYQSRRGECGAAGALGGGSSGGCAGSSRVGCHLVSCDEGGGIAVWRARSAGAYERLLTIDGSVACAGVGVRRGMVVAGRVDGTVRIYELVGGC